MKLNKIIPFTSCAAIVASFAPIGLTSCAQYQFINILNGFTPNTDPIEERQFDSYEDVCQYYLKLNKNILLEDYMWSLGEYVKENMEFPSPILPFKLTKIDAANATIEDWFTQPYKDESKKDVFYTTYSMVFQLSGQTEPRQNFNGPLGSYLPNSYAVISLTTKVNKLPYTIKNKYVGSNTTDARWYLTPASNDILNNDDAWTVSSTATITYKLKGSHDQSISTIDTLGAYWYKDNRYDPILDPQKTYLYEFIYDAIIYGSYHLKNCTLKN